ncbi:MAG: bacterioferritin [Steroidobacterales bacterium]
MSAYPAEPRQDPTHRFLCDVAEIRRRARGHIGEAGAAPGQSADRNAVLRLLNTALSTELICALRYRRYCSMSAQALADSARDEFVKRAQEEQSHADQIAARIVELGGEPNPDPPSATDRGDGDGADGEDLADMLAEDLIAERIAIDTYREIIRYVGESDAATRQLFESIVAVEQQHAEELAGMREHIRRQARGAIGVNHVGHPVEVMR